MYSHPKLNITWGKAYNEVYCHHASLFIPCDNVPLFAPETILVTVMVRTNIIKGKKVLGHSDARYFCHLRYSFVDGGALVPLESSEIIDALSANMWTMLKTKERGRLKMFPVSISFQNPADREEWVYKFDADHMMTPMLYSEPQFIGMCDGDKIDLTLNLS